MSGEQTHEKGQAASVGSTAWLGLLRATANEVLAEAIDLHRAKGRDTPFATDAVNWADLRCVRAVWERDDGGMDGPRIEISEASPGGACFLCMWVTDRLAERGFPNVHATTEW